MRWIRFIVFVLLCGPVCGQTGVLSGTVIDANSNEPLPFASVKLLPGELSTTTDVDGKFRFTGLTPGNYSIEIRFSGYQSRAISDIPVTNAKPTDQTIGLKATTEELDAFVVISPFTEKEESPVSLRSLSASEIDRFPGANRDVSKVVQSLPGFSPQPSFRNDIVIRGGAPNENRFFLDGIEVPNINHFATQGGSGGPVGLININFVQNVDFYSGAFPVARGNALSSVIAFDLKEPNSKKLNSTFTLGSSDLGITFDTPLSEKTGLIFSYRRSYLQFLFAALKLPFLPTYNDAQFKLTHRINDKNELTFIGLGALDNFALNTGVNDGVTDTATIERNRYILGNIPDNDQWNYTIGGRYRHFRKNGFHTLVLSRNHLSNRSEKYTNNDDSDPANLILSYESHEIENKFRYENLVQTDQWKIVYGLGYQLATYRNTTFNKIYTQAGPQTVQFNSDLSLSKFALFGQISREWKRLTASIGIRADATDYSKEMLDPSDQLSPRLSASYKLTNRLTINANIGRYVQLPAYTILGYRDSSGTLVNKNSLYITSDHLVAGFKYNLATYARISIEGFYKKYTNYPFSIRDSISIANLGADFGVVGSEPVSPVSIGRSYGLEFLFQQKLYKGFYGILAYTLVRSEYKAPDGDYVPSSWDNRHVVSLTGGKKFKNNWDFGLRWLFSGGAPYTPYDIATSSLISSWDVRGSGVRDYSRLNTLRAGSFHQLDIRVDKRFYFKKWSLNIYLDIQNVYGFAAETPPYLIAETNTAGDPVVDPNDASRYLVRTVDSSSGTVLPTIGLVVEF